MKKRGGFTTSLYQVVDIIIPAILLVLLLLFVHRSVSGEAFKDDYISKDIALMIDSLDKSPYISVDYIINQDIRLKIKNHEVKVDLISNSFNSNINVDFDSEIIAGTKLTFIKDKNNLGVKVNA